MNTQRRNVAAGVIGNVLEWYDFAVYGYMVAIISGLFFPSSDPTVSIIAAFSAFAAGYFARPLGGAIFGWIGDRYGRKVVLTASVTMMGVATVSMGFLPTYSQVGIIAPILLVSLRIFQGISVGGEYTGSITFVMEHAPKDRRGWLTSWVGVGAVLGFLIGSGVGALLTANFSETQMSEWGWRIPFIAGGLIAILGFFIRRHLTEPEREAILDVNQSPILVAFRDHWRQMLQLVGLTLGVSVMFYYSFVYADDFLIQTKGMVQSQVLTINTVGLALMVVLIPISGWLSDRYGRKPVLFSGGIALLIGAPITFIAFQYATVTSVIIGQVVSAIAVASILGVNPVALAELLPERVRVTGFSIAYGVALALFGGTTPLIIATLIKETQWAYSPLPYIVLLCVVSLITVFTLKESRLVNTSN